MAYEHIQWAVDGAVGLITLNRPTTLNAVTAQMLDELRDCLVAAEESQDVRALLLTGAGRGFCAGADLNRIASDHGDAPAEPPGRMLDQRYPPVILRLRNIEKPVVAVVNGPAVGAGLGIALACDIRIASDRARFGAVFVRLGLGPDSGVSWLLPRLVGPERARELLFTGRILEASEAVEMGIAGRVVPHDSAVEEGMSLARALAAGPTLAIGHAKRALNHSEVVGLADAMANEARLQAELTRTQDVKEGVRAFLEKRPPRFTGT